MGGEWGKASLWGGNYALICFRVKFSSMGGWENYPSNFKKYLKLIGYIKYFVLVQTALIGFIVRFTILTYIEVPACYIYKIKLILQLG